MDSSHYEDIVENYLASLEDNTSFDWKSVPDDPELLSVLKMTREMWASTHAEVEASFCNRVEEGLCEMMTPEVQKPHLRFQAWIPVLRFASVGLVGILAVVVVFNVAGDRPFASNPFSPKDSGKFSIADRPVLPNSNANANADRPSNTSFASNEADNTEPETQEPNGNRSVNTSSEPTFLDVSDLDPDDQMDALVSDFSTDFSEILDDVNDDGLVRMSSDIQLVSF